MLNLNQNEIKDVSGGNAALVAGGLMLGVVLGVCIATEGGNSRLKKATYALITDFESDSNRCINKVTDIAETGEISATEAVKSSFECINDAFTGSVKNNLIDKFDLQ